MTHSILFRGYEKLPNRKVGWGDIFAYSYACYHLGKEKGYKDIDIVFPRFNYEERWKVSDDDYNYQKTDYLPWKYIDRRNKINVDDYDEVIDTTVNNSLYLGFPGIEMSGLYVNLYFDVYYNRTGIKPLLDLPREKRKKQYILFQYRNSPLGSYTDERKTSLDEFMYIYRYIKRHLGDKYELWYIGEPNPIQEEFDRIIPMMYNDLDGFCKIIGNSSMVIGGHSGPPHMALHFKDLPVIRFSMIPEYDGPERLLKEISRAVLHKYHIKRHPSWMRDDMLYREFNMIPDDKVKVLYASRGEPVTDRDLLKIIEDNL